MFDRPQVGERTILVCSAHVRRDHAMHVESLPSLIQDPSHSEFYLLAQSAGADIVGQVRHSRLHPDPKFFLGTGKVDEILALKNATEAELVILDHRLSPAQERNLERALDCRVLDRTGLILDIFAQRAQTHEGKLQVELAQLQYMSTRLVRGWTHLERQKGGIGLRGPGETQLETDRRLIRDRIAMIQKRLQKVRQQRQLGRQRRKKNTLPTLSLVGYTNAGKSTLFNQLTQADVYVQDQLFATLDPTLRQVNIPHFGQIIVVDTVGFIRDLPHDLVEAFRATLEETSEADLLLHVVDAHADDRDELIIEVNKVLQQVGADQRPTLMIYNKIDLLDHLAPRVDYDEAGLPKAVWLSAQSNQGLDLLKQAIQQRLSTAFVNTQIIIPPHQSKLYAALHQHHAIVSETTDDQGNMIVDITLSQAILNQIYRECGLEK